MNDDVVSDLLLNRRDARSERMILTPEGVELRFQLAEVGDRAVALLLDGFLLVLGMIAVVLLSSCAGAYGWVFGIVAIFVLVNGYFIWFEGRKQGYTPGKRKMGIRVIDRDGGPLTPEAVIARNLTRNFETIFPLSAILTPADAGGAGGLATLFATGWLVILLLLPFFNKDRLRAGDLIAGTLVVRAPKESLLPDVGARKSDGKSTREAYSFSGPQLQIYGIYELQVLEQVLRSKVANRKTAMTTVATQIREKIGYEAEISAREAPRFLRDFYAAQRSHLEQRMLLGDRREKKVDGAAGQGPGPRGPVAE